MFIKNHLSSIKKAARVFGFAVAVLAASLAVSAQVNVRSVPAAPPVSAPAEDFTWWYVTLFVLALGLAGAIFWYLNNKKAQQEAATKSRPTASAETDLNAVDADKELEWLRKNQKVIGRKNVPSAAERKKRREKASPKIAEAVEANHAAPVSTDAPINSLPMSLPIFSIQRLELARPFDQLAISNDEDLMTAVEQAYDENEEDEEVRDLSIRILAAFKKRNSVEALAQIALYDLSASLRSKAVSVLSDFDHESVFEPILLANADPTREVRAAAARGLTKLSFDRADAWTRISETGEEGRMAQAARAAVESGFVDRSFDRLISKDRKQAYEAFALMALLIKAGDTEKIFHALETHREMDVRRAILHTIKVTKDRDAIEKLHQLLEKNNLPIEFQEEIDKTIEEIGFVMT